jgi:type IV fimbrial biogenesis protein FimT
MNTHTTHPAAARSTQPARASAARTRARGFTLVELLLVLGISAVLLTLGTPAISGMMNSSRLTSASNSLLSSMLLARSEAIKRSSRVVLCKTADGTSCAATGGWEQGWIVFHDVNNNGLRDSGETIIQRTERLPASMRLTGNTNVAKYVSFLSTGVTKLTGGGFQAGTLTICNQAASNGEARNIVLNAIGRPRVERVTGTSCA